MPPGPPACRGAERFQALVRNPLASFLEGAERFGDVVRYQYGPFVSIVLSGPEPIVEAFVRNHARYKKSRSYDRLRFILGEGLVASEGDFWKRQRRLSQPAFHRKRVAALADTMARCTGNLVARWSKASGDAWRSVDLLEEMTRLTLRIVGHTMFSTELSEDAGALGPAISVALSVATQTVEGAARMESENDARRLSMAAAQAELHGAIDRIIAERRADPRDRGDLLSMLMAAEDVDTHERMSDVQLRNEVLTTFLAGHETIANAMCWTFKLLTEHPDAAERVVEEVVAHLGERAPSFEDAAALTFTDMVLRESMRLFPPVWCIEREALVDDTIAGFHVPAGATVAACPWTLHRNPDLWDAPEMFDPSRFTPARSEGRHRYAYIPFGVGPRTCIGTLFAMLEAKVILSMVLRAFEVDVESPASIGTDPGISLRPLGGMRARVRRRG